jgi:hypothetical protein
MSEIAEYAQGTPCWVELWTQDRPAAMDFYARIFGWQYQVAAEEQHFFTVAQVRGRAVAGLLTPPGGPSAPTTWGVYLAVADLDATLAAVGAAGGQSLTGVVTVPGTDVRIALFLDATGAAFGAWESKSMPGAELANEPGTQVWNEHMSADPAAARKFYADVFGVRIGDRVSPDFDYTPFAAAGRGVGGIGIEQTGAPRWHTYFAVADTDASAELVATNGGKVHDVHDSPFGRIAVCEDPEGAGFNLLSVQS